MGPWARSFVTIVLLAVAGGAIYVKDQWRQSGPSLASTPQPMGTESYVSESGRVVQPWQVTPTEAQEAAVIESAASVVVRSVRSSRWDTVREDVPGTTADDVLVNYAADFRRQDESGLWRFAAVLRWTERGWTVHAPLEMNKI